MRWLRSAVGAAVISVVLAGTFAAAAEGATAQSPWLTRALGLQFRLADDVPMRNAPWVGTHNSFNSVAEMGTTISTSDPNQGLTLVEQLELGVRSLELDLHWTTSPSTGSLAPVVCHAFPNHFPCSSEKTLGPVLDEISGWLRAPANSDQVLFVYIEDHLDDQAGYDAAAATLVEKLGDLLYAPSAAAGCQRLPLSLTRDRMLAAGKRVVVVGNTPCGVGTMWPALVFNWEKHLETGPGHFTGYPRCGSDYTRAQYESSQVRYFEDGRPSQSLPRITASLAAGMARCGVDLVGLDQLTPNDPRLRALVWSWAKGQPARGTCAVQTARSGSLLTPWKTLDCGQRRRPACRRGSAWIVGAKAVAETAASAACRARGAKFAVPRTGFEAQLLRKRMLAAGASAVLLGYVKRRGEWTALDRRPG